MRIKDIQCKECGHLHPDNITCLQFSEAMSAWDEYDDEELKKIMKEEKE